MEALIFREEGKTTGWNAVNICRKSKRPVTNERDIPNRRYRQWNDRFGIGDPLLSLDLTATVRCRRTRNSKVNINNWRFNIKIKNKREKVYKRI